MPCPPWHIRAGMTHLSVAGRWTFRHWEDESSAVVRLAAAGTTHLIGGEALAVVQAAASRPEGLTMPEIAHALGLGDEADPEAEAALSRIIEALLESGVLRRPDADAQPGPEDPR